MLLSDFWVFFKKKKEGFEKTKRGFFKKKLFFKTLFCLGREPLTNTEPSGAELPSGQYGSFRKLGVSYFGVLIIRILLCRVLYWGPLFSETPIFQYLEMSANSWARTNPIRIALAVSTTSVCKLRACNSRCQALKRWTLNPQSTNDSICAEAAPHPLTSTRRRNRKAISSQKRLSRAFVFGVVQGVKVQGMRLPMQVVVQLRCGFRDQNFINYRYPRQRGRLLCFRIKRFRARVFQPKDPHPDKMRAWRQALVLGSGVRTQRPLGCLSEGVGVEGSGLRI